MMPLESELRMEVIFGILFITVIITWCVYNRNKAEERRRAIELQNQKIDFVKSHSQCLYAIKNLNKNYGFKEFDAHPRYQRNCNSKTQLDNFNIDNHMLLTIEDSQNYFTGIVKAVKYNRQKYSQYEQQYNSTIRNITSKCNYNSITSGSIIDVDEFKTIEEEEYKKLKKTAIRDFNIELIVCYRSPRGRNSYSKTYRFNCHDIEHYLDDFHQMQQNKQSAVYQRQLMTPKMRYNILKRDGFKCVLCGRSQKVHGAILHVDHIKPISKGGKTEESNLRTLCEMCNLGKSDAYDPYGLN